MLTSNLRRQRDEGGRCGEARRGVRYGHPVAPIFDHVNDVMPLQRANATRQHYGSRSPPTLCPPPSLPLDRPRCPSSPLSLHPKCHTNRPPSLADATTYDMICIAAHWHGVASLSTPFLLGSTALLPCKMPLLLLRLTIWSSTKVSMPFPFRNSKIHTNITLCDGALDQVGVVLGNTTRFPSFIMLALASLYWHFPTYFPFSQLLST